MMFMARDVPVWRRRLIEWTAGEGSRWYQTMIEMGRQGVRPGGPAPTVARWLAEREVSALREADLWFVDRDTMTLVNAATQSMPPFAPQPVDLPSRSGFVLFAAPLAARDPREEPMIDELIDSMAAAGLGSEGRLLADKVRWYAVANDKSVEDAIVDLSAVVGSGDPERAELTRMTLDRVCGTGLRREGSRILNNEIKIVGASWAPYSLSGDPRFPAGGVWISFYSTSSISPSHLATVYGGVPGLPDLLVDNEAVVPWCPEDGRREDYSLADTDVSTYGWARTLFAAFRLGSQRGLCETRVERVERPERRRAQRAGLPARDVTVIRLRGHGTSSLAGGTGSKHTHRYPVRGHWRQQWYPRAQDHRPIWIDQHVRGPEGTEIRGGERVTVV